MTTQVPIPPPRSWRDEYVVVDGIRTHYLAEGEGPVLLLLHSGEFGASAELSWEYLIGPLSRRHRVIAPDWLGYGETDKVHDFSGKRQRMLQHLRRLLDVLDITEAVVVANSMGASFLLHELAAHPGRLPVSRFVSISGGGFVPANGHRQALLDYDCTMPAMRLLLAALFHEPVWHEDNAYVQRRLQATLQPGAWESVAVARFKAPHVPPRGEFGQPDSTAYENIRVPCLLIAGEHDKLRDRNYTAPLIERLADAQLVVIPDAGHCSNIETPDAVVAAIERFLDVDSAPTDFERN